MDENTTPVVPKQKRTRKPNAKARFVVTMARPVAAYHEEKAKTRGLDVATMLEFDAIAEFQSSSPKP